MKGSPNKKPIELPDIIVDDGDAQNTADLPMPIADVTMSGGRVGLANLSSTPLYDPRIPYETYSHIHLSSDNADTLLNDRTGIPSTASFQMSLEDPIVARDNTELYINVESATIPVSWYVINRHNDKLRFIERVDNPYLGFYDTDATIEIPHGNYTASELCTSISALMNQSSDLGLRYTVSYSESTRKIRVLADTTTASAGNTNHTITLRFDDNQSVHRVIGFLSESYTFHVVGVPLLTVFQGWVDAPKMVNLRGYTNVFIQTNYQLQNVIHSRTANRSNVLAKIHISDEKIDSQGYEHYQNDSDFKSPVMGGRIDQIHIELIDQYGELVELNAQDWSATLLVTHRRIY